jgi:hypothetical protein
MKPGVDFSAQTDIESSDKTSSDPYNLTEIEKYEAELAQQRGWGPLSGADISTDTDDLHGGGRAIVHQPTLIFKQRCGDCKVEYTADKCGVGRCNAYRCTSCRGSGPCSNCAKLAILKRAERGSDSRADSDSNEWRKEHHRLKQEGARRRLPGPAVIPKPTAVECGACHGVIDNGRVVHCLNCALPLHQDLEGCRVVDGKEIRCRPCAEKMEAGARRAEKQVRRRPTAKENASGDSTFSSKLSGDSEAPPSPETVW